MFRREGPEAIAVIPVTQDAPELTQTTKPIRLADSLGLTSALVRNAYLDYLLRVNGQARAYDPIIKSNGAPRGSSFIFCTKQRSA